MKTWSSRCLVLLFALLAASVATANAQERFGAITGTVTDAQQAAVPGATITAVNSASQAARTVVSGADGTFRLAELEPGRYTVTVELQGFQKVEVSDVAVLLGRTVEFPAVLQVGAVSEVISVTADVTRSIDLRSVTLSHNVTAEELDRIPKARSFQGIALVAPGVNTGDIEAGFQVHGASGAENSFLVDGVPTNSLIDGRARENTVFEYLQEVQVKTSGINAEYGGALGGVISAVTKSGGNRYSGEAHYYYIGNGLSASPVERIQLSPVDNETVFHVQDEKQRDNRHEFGGSLGGPIVRDRLFFFGSVSPRLVRRTNDYLFSNGVEPGSIDQKQTLTQAFGKLSYSSGRRVTASGSLLATPQHSVGNLPAYRGTGTNFTTSSLEQNEPFKTQGFDVRQYNASGDVTIALSPMSSVSVRGGHFYDWYGDTGISKVTSYTYQRTSVGADNIPANLQGPINTSNTPRTIINNYDLTKRSFINADYNHTFAAAGVHQVKAGVGYQRSVNDVDVSYPGGYVYIYWNTAFVSPFLGSQSGTYGYYRVDDFGTYGKVGGNIISLYAQDTWSITPRVTLNVGLRTERETVPAFQPTVRKNAFQFGFGEKLAPRLGASFDVRGDGTLKLSGSWGRYYDWTKYSIARGSYGGDVWHIYYRALDTLAIDTLNLNNMPGRDLWGSSDGFRDLRSTNFDNTDPNIKPMFQDSTTVGVEYEVTPTTIVTANYVHNILNRTIEDFSALVDGSNVYSIGNPGEGIAAIYPASYPATADFPMPKPKRQYDALELGLSRRFSNNWFASANYTWSRLYGNYSGLANGDEIPDADHEHHVGDDAAVGRQHRACREQLARRMGHRHHPVGFKRTRGDLRPAADRSSSRREAVRRVLDTVRSPAWRLLLRRQRHADVDRRQLARSRAAARERTRRHGSDAGPHADRSAGVAGSAVRPQEGTFRVERDQPVQPEDADAHLQSLEQGRSRRQQHDPGRRHRHVAGESGGRLRLQRVDSRYCGRRERLRPTLRPARSLAGRAAGTV
ncbi:MAG: TonB-dependent receptor [Vicinamibacterales bacterium]